MLFIKDFSQSAGGEYRFCFIQNSWFSVSFSFTIKAFASSTESAIGFSTSTLLCSKAIRDWDVWKPFGVQIFITSGQRSESKSASSPLTFDNAGSGVKFVKVHIADVVKDAPVPVGGTLKVISGQKLVLESLTANVNDKIYAYASGANSCDVIASVLEDVS